MDSSTTDRLAGDFVKFFYGALNAPVLMPGAPSDLGPGHFSPDCSLTITRNDANTNQVTIDDYCGNESAFRELQAIVRDDDVLLCSKSFTATCSEPGVEVVVQGDVYTSRTNLAVASFVQTFRLVFIAETDSWVINCCDVKFSST